MRDVTYMNKSCHTFKCVNVCIQGILGSGENEGSRENV